MISVNSHVILSDPTVPSIPFRLPYLSNKNTIVFTIKWSYSLQNWNQKSF